MEVIKLFAFLLFFPLCVSAQLINQQSNGALSAASSDAAYVNVTGDTMTGPLTLSGSSLTVSGTVGVGTTTPEAKLEVAATTAAQAQFSGYSVIAAGANDAHGAIKAGGSATNYGLFDYNSGANTLLTIRNTYGGNAASAIGLDIGTTRIMSLAQSGSVTIPGSSFSVGTSTLVVSGGKVGIGNINPSSKLHLSSGTMTIDGTSPQMTVGNSGASGAFGKIQLKGRSNASNQIWFGDESSDFRGQINVSGNSGSPANTMQLIANQVVLQPSAGNVGINTTAPASTLSIGTPLDGTTNYMQVDTLLADTAGPPAATDCDAATEVGRMVVSSRYTATASNFLWVCMQTAASTFAWWKTELTAP